jgi:hypothetical protein
VDKGATDDYWDTPGAMFEIAYEDLDSAGARKQLSEAYYRDHYGTRNPLTLVLPDGNIWIVDSRASNEAAGWDLTCDPPNLTARPSIMTDTYHGWLTDGVLSNDLEGRTYD